LNRDESDDEDESSKTKSRPDVSSIHGSDEIINKDRRNVGNDERDDDKSDDSRRGTKRESDEEKKTSPTTNKQPFGSRQTCFSHHNLLSHMPF